MFSRKLFASTVYLQNTQTTGGACPLALVSVAMFIGLSC